MPKFTYTGPKFPYPELESETLPTGERTYFTPQGPAPSVTTLLKVIPKPDLDAWIARVGEAEAERIKTEAATIGQYMHDMMEHYVLGTEWTGPDNYMVKEAKAMVQAIKLFGLKHLEEVWGVEVALHIENIVAGRTDLVGRYHGHNSIIDYKNSINGKKPEHLESYYYQIAAYKTSHEWMFPGTTFTQGVLLIGIRPNQYRPASVQTVIINEDTLNEYQEKWLKLVEEHYSR